MSARGFMLYGDFLDSRVFIEFLQRLLRELGRELFRILGHLRVRRSRNVPGAVSAP
jgi:hypothetical protein